MSEAATSQPRRSSRASTMASSAKRTNEEVVDPPQPKKAKKVKKDEEEGEAVDEPTPDVAKLEIGDVLPELTLKNEKEEDVQVSTLAAEKGVIFFLVPKADTPGCTTQACGYRDIYPDFESVGYDVYCLSADTSAAQTKWKTKKELPYGLLSDKKRILITALGAGAGGKTQRSHFIFEKGTGKLLEKKIPVKPGDSPKLALEFVKSLGSSTTESEAKPEEANAAESADANPAP